MLRERNGGQQESSDWPSERPRWCRPSCAVTGPARLHSVGPLFQQPPRLPLSTPALALPASRFQEQHPRTSVTPSLQAAALTPLLLLRLRCAGRVCIPLSAGVRFGGGGIELLILLALVGWPLLHAVVQPEPRAPLPAPLPLPPPAQPLGLHQGSSQLGCGAPQPTNNVSPRGCAWQGGEIRRLGGRAHALGARKLLKASARPRHTIRH